MTYRMISTYLSNLSKEQIKLRRQWGDLIHAIKMNRAEVKEIEENKANLIAQYSPEDKPKPYSTIERDIERIDFRFMQEEGDEGDSVATMLNRIIADEIDRAYEDSKHNGREMVGMIRQVIKMSGNLELLRAMDELY